MGEAQSQGWGAAKLVVRGTALLLRLDRPTFRRSLAFNRLETFRYAHSPPTRPLSRTVELYALLIADALMLGVAWIAFESLAESYGWFLSPGWISPLLFCAVFVVGWMVLYAFAGLYEQRYADSRFDELVSLAKVTAFGALALMFVYLLDHLQPGSVQGAILALAGIVFGAVAISRVAVRTVQKFLPYDSCAKIPFIADLKRR